MTRTPRPYQLDAIAALLRSKSKRNLLVMATGCGKTFTAATYVAQHTSGKVLWIAHRTELIDQAAEALQAATGDFPEREKAQSWANDELKGGSRIIVGSVQTLSSKWTNSIRAARFDPSEFDLVVVDEAHHATAASYRKVLEHFEGVPLLGLTATPKRTDGVGLRHAFDHVPFQYGIREAIDDGWLVPVHVRTIRCGALDLSSVRTTLGDLNGADLARVVEGEETLHQMASGLVQYATDRSTLVFCHTVEQATRMAEILRRHGRTADVVTGKTPDEQRAELFRSFNDGSLQFLVNVGVATEGTDLPRCSVIGSCRPTKSASLMTQIIGRALRPFGADLSGESAAIRRTAIGESTKPYAEVLDFTGHAGKHKLVSPIDVLGGADLPEEVVAKAKELAEAAEASSSVDDYLEAAAAELEAEQQQRLAEAEAERKRLEEMRRKVFFSTQHTSRQVNPFDLLDIPPDTGLDPTKPIERATPKQVAALKRMGVPNPEMLYRQEAHRLLSRLIGNQRRNGPTFKQLQILAKFGYPTDGVTRSGASKIIDQLAANGWRKA